MGAIDYQSKIHEAVMSFSDIQELLPILEFENMSHFNEFANHVRSNADYGLSDSIIAEALIDIFVTNNFLLHPHDSLEDFNRKRDTAILHCLDRYKDCEGIFREHLKLIVEANCSHISINSILSYSGGYSSLMKCIGEEYPEDTCPMIDSVIDDIKAEINDYHNEIEDIESDYSELEDKLGELEIYSEEYSDFIEENEMNEKLAEIESKKEEIEELEGFIDEGEQLRSACEAARRDLKAMSDDIKGSISLYFVDDMIISEVCPSESTVHCFMTYEANKTPCDQRGLYSEAMSNHDLFFVLANKLEEIAQSKDKIEDHLCVLVDFNSIDDFIDWYLK